MDFFGKEHMTFKLLNYDDYDTTMVADVNQWLLRKNLNNAFDLKRQLRYRVH